MIKQVKHLPNKKSMKSIVEGIVNIKSTLNNTIVNVTDSMGNTYFWASAGNSGFKGSKKKTPFAAQSAAEKIALQAYNHGLRTIKIIITGPGRGREPVIRALQGSGFEITSIKDVTRIPHNGCRPPKKRRV